MAGQDDRHKGNIASRSPDWLASMPDMVPLDVRMVLAAGQDPLPLIMTAAQAVAPGGLLAVDAPFNPSPLRRILAAAGFSSYGRRLSEGHWRVFFCRDGAGDWERDADVSVGPEGAMSWHEEDGLHVDVRRLTPPQPMLAVLRLLDDGGCPPRVIVHHDRVPHLLLPELAERGWTVADMREETANVCLWLERES